MVKGVCGVGVFLGEIRKRGGVSLGYRAGKEVKVVGVRARASTAVEFLML